MKTTALFLLATLIMFSSCKTYNEQSGSKKAKNQVSEMEKMYDDLFINMIPEIQLPYKMECGNISFLLEAMDRENFRPWTPAGYELIGKLKSYDSNNYIVLKDGEAGNPVLYITGNEGTRIAQHNLYENACYENDSIKFNSTTTITSATHFVVKESKTFKKSESKSVTLQEYHINEKGELEKGNFIAK